MLKEKVLLTYSLLFFSFNTQAIKRVFVIKYKCRGDLKDISKVVSLDSDGSYISREKFQFNEKGTETFVERRGDNYEKDKLVLYTNQQSDKKSFKEYKVTNHRIINVTLENGDINLAEQFKSGLVFKTFLTRKEFFKNLNVTKTVKLDYALRVFDRAKSKSEKLGNLDHYDVSIFMNEFSNSIQSQHKIRNKRIELTGRFSEKYGYLNYSWAIYRDGKNTYLESCSLDSWKDL